MNLNKIFILVFQIAVSDIASCSNIGALNSKENDLENNVLQYNASIKKSIIGNSMAFSNINKQNNLYYKADKNNPIVINNTDNELNLNNDLELTNIDNNITII